jgi:RHS repeat-associated protein
VTALAYNIQGGVSDIIIPETINPLDPVKRSLGEKQYELSNHLGNVLVTVSDRKLAEGTTGSSATGYRAEVLFASDYYPFGMQMPGRIYSGETAYRYGFNGMEKDDELAGEGNSYTTEWRQLDARIGRWLSTDPVVHAHFSPYSSFDNNPIYFLDPKGSNSGDYKSAQTGEILGSDGVADGLVHTINEEDFEINPMFTPEGNKNNLSSKVISTDGYIANPQLIESETNLDVGFVFEKPQFTALLKASAGGTGEIEGGIGFDIQFKSANVIGFQENDWYAAQINYGNPLDDSDNSDIKETNWSYGFSIPGIGYKIHGKDGPGDTFIEKTMDIQILLFQYREIFPKEYNGYPTNNTREIALNYGNALGLGLVVDGGIRLPIFRQQD